MIHVYDANGNGKIIVFNHNGLKCITSMANNLFS